MAALQPGYQPFGRTLDGIAARLAVPFAAGQIGGDLGLAERLELELGLGDFFAQRAVGGLERDGREHPVASAGEQFEALARGRLVLGLGQDAPADCDDGVARQHMGAVAGDRLGLLARHALGIYARQFGGVRGLVDLRGQHARGRDPEPREQFAPARTGGS